MLLLALNGTLLTHRPQCLQRSPRHPDFRHKRTKQGLWLNNQDKPLWVDSRLPTLNAWIRDGGRFSHCGSSTKGDEFQSLCEEGELDKALEVLLCMDRPAGTPLKMYRSLLQACTKKKALAQTKRVHAYLAKHGLETSSFLGESVVSTLVKCGGLEDALQLFQCLPHRTVSCWTAIISGYATSRQGREALKMYKLMQEEGVQPNAYTFVSLLKACGSIADLEEGKRVHADVLKHGCDSHLFVGNCLIDMYGKCGSIVDAQNVFQGLLKRDVVSWNAMLAAYAQRGQGEKGFQLYKQMQELGVCTNDRTFVSVLQACGILAEKEEAVVVDGLSIKVKSLEKGRTLHADAEKNGVDADVFVGSTLVSMYGKCGSILDARNVFDGLTKRNVVSWNAMLAAYAQQGQAEKALQLFDQMTQKGVSPTYRTLASALQACGMLEGRGEDVLDGRPTKISPLEKGKALHAVARRKGLESHVYVGSALVSMYGKFGSIADARHVFDTMSEQDVVCWNAMLAAYVEHDQADKALQLYQKMHQEGVSPDGYTIVSALQACCMLAEIELDVVEDSICTKVKSLELGKAIHADAQNRAYDSDFFVGSILISMYGKCGSIADAQKVFDGLSKRDVVSWNAMLAAYVEQGQGDMALLLYTEMQEQLVGPNEITLVSVLRACSQTGCVVTIEEIHQTVVCIGSNWSPLVLNTLINAYGRCARMVDAQAVFDSLPQPDVVSWNALIVGYARQGDCAASLLSYDKMQMAGVKPNGVTFLALISACGHAGLVDKGVDYFESMSRDYGIPPEVEHYSSMVDLLGRTGYFTRLEELLSTMPVKPDLSMWLCMLSACRKHGKIVLAKQAFDGALSLQPKSAAPYVLMSNIYAHAGLWDLAREVHDWRQAAGAWKKPGQSWIEHEQRVHSFVVGDVKHPDQKKLEDLLGKVSWAVLDASSVRRGGDAVEKEWGRQPDGLLVTEAGFT